MRKLLIFLSLFGGVMEAKPFQKKVMSQKPRVIRVDNFLTPAECNHLIRLAKPELQKSMVVNSRSTKGMAHAARVSEGMFLTNHIYDPVIVRIEKRIADLTGIPRSHGEALHVLHYIKGGEYKPHFDTFDPSSFGGKACFDRGGQRVASVILYLANTKEGGETIFPKADLSVKPVKGQAILFYNTLPNGKVDSYSLHGGAPVLQGEKWIATKWLRERVFK